MGLIHAFGSHPLDRFSVSDWWSLAVWHNFAYVSLRLGLYYFGRVASPNLTLAVIPILTETKIRKNRNHGA